MSLWKVLDSLGRNDARRMGFSDAVRNFLTRIPVVIRDDGAYLHGQRYDSDEFRETKLLEKVVKHQSIEIQAFILDACVRHIWIEHDSKIIQLDMQVALRVNEEILYISLAQLQEIDSLRKRDGAYFREHRNALASETLEKFKMLTGHEWDEGVRKSGKPKRGSYLAKQEAREATNIMHGKNAA